MTGVVQSIKIQVDFGTGVQLKESKDKFKF